MHQIGDCIKRSAGARFAAWERGIRGVLLSLDDVAQAARAIALRRGGAAGGGGGGRGGVGARQRAKESLGAGDAEESVGAGGAESPGEAGAVETATSVDDGSSASPPSSRVSWSGPWARLDHFAVGLGVLCLALLLAAPWLTGHSLASALATLGGELHPLP